MPTVTVVPTCWPATPPAGCWSTAATARAASSASMVVGSGWNAFTSIVSASVRADATLPAFTSSVAAIDSATATRMRYSYRAGCPVGLADLRLVRLRYYGFDRVARTGELVVHRTATTAVVGPFRAMYAARFPIQRMVLIDAYRGDDHASMDANNTSAFNCRKVEGGSGWSEHAYGTGHRHQHRAEPLCRRVDRPAQPPAAPT